MSGLRLTASNAPVVLDPEVDVGAANCGKAVLIVSPRPTSSRVAHRSPGSPAEPQRSSGASCGHPVWTPLLTGVIRTRGASFLDERAFDQGSLIHKWPKEITAKRSDS
jgi:hypothetical protein